VDQEGGAFSFFAAQIDGAVVSFGAQADVFEKITCGVQVLDKRTNTEAFEVSTSVSYSQLSNDLTTLFDVNRASTVLL
jgi:hypothetical protein